MPQRIQLSRKKGWRKPEGVIVVSRPTMWGNPFTIANALESGYATNDLEARELCVSAFRDWIYAGALSEWWFGNELDRWQWMRDNIESLRGKDLACWCPIGPCHADVLIEFANR